MPLVAEVGVEEGGGDEGDAVAGEIARHHGRMPKVRGISLTAIATTASVLGDERAQPAPRRPDPGEEEEEGDQVRPDVARLVVEVEDGDVILQVGVIDAVAVRWIGSTGMRGQEA